MLELRQVMAVADIISNEDRIRKMNQQAKSLEDTNDISKMKENISKHYKTTEGSSQ